MLRLGDSLKHTATRRVRGCAETAVNLLFPPCCAYCGADQPEQPVWNPLCDECTRRLTGSEPPRCRRCGCETPFDADQAGRCPHCRKSSFRFDGVITLGNYADDLRSAVLRIKRPHAEPLARALAGLLHDCRGAQLHELAAEGIVPVPMHWARRAVRGTNSPETVAAKLSRRLRIPVVRRVLCRRRNTRPQGGLPRGRRIENVRGAFRVSAGYDYSDARVMLVDDIMTTGATLHEAAKVLKAAGAARVTAVVLARAHGPN